MPDFVILRATGIENIYTPLVFFQDAMFHCICRHDMLMMLDAYAGAITITRLLRC